MVEPHQMLVDTLVAATLVAASLAVLFVLWQADVAASLALKSSDDTANDGTRRATLRATLLLRAGPLFLVSLLTLLILAHRSVMIVQEALTCQGDCSLDDIKALYLVNTLVVALLTVGLFGQVFALFGVASSLGGLLGKAKNDR